MENYQSQALFNLMDQVEMKKIQAQEGGLGGENQGSSSGFKKKNVDTNTLKKELLLFGQLCSKLVQS